jgi:hypothetical protein
MAVFVLINILSCRCCSISSWVCCIYSSSVIMGPYFFHWRGPPLRICLGSTCDVQSCWEVRLDWLELVLCPTLWISWVTHFGLAFFSFLLCFYLFSPSFVGDIACVLLLYFEHMIVVYIFWMAVFVGKPQFSHINISHKNAKEWPKQKLR